VIDQPQLSFDMLNGSAMRFVDMRGILEALHDTREETTEQDHLYLVHLHLLVGRFHCRALSIAQ